MGRTLLGSRDSTMLQRFRVWLFVHQLTDGSAAYLKEQDYGKLLNQNMLSLANIRDEAVETCHRCIA